MKKNVIPIPWDYNPSSWKQRVRVALIATLGVIISAYMGLFQWGAISSVWDPVFGKQTEEVLLSNVSHWMTRLFHMPDGVLGALAYLGDIIFGLAGSTRRWQCRPWIVVLFGIDVIPLGIVSIILVLIQYFVLKTWCFLCLVTALISLILIILAYDEVLSSILFLYKVWKKSKSWKLLWLTFWGNYSKEAFEAGEEMLKARYVGKRL